MTALLRAPLRGAALVLLLAHTSLGWCAPLPPKPPPCADREYRQFDFWVGDWDVVDTGRPADVLAHARVEKILNGCVLHEIYEGADGHKGESFSIYDITRRTWHQTWVTDHGQLLTIEGRLDGGTAMILEGTDHRPDGKPRKVRGEWRPVSDGVREVAARSTDGGTTWQPWFDLLFRRRR